MRQHDQDCRDRAKQTPPFPPCRGTYVYVHVRKYVRICMYDVCICMYECVLLFFLHMLQMVIPWTGSQEHPVSCRHDNPCHICMLNDDGKDKCSQQLRQRFAANGFKRWSVNPPATTIHNQQHTLIILLKHTPCTYTHYTCPLTVLHTTHTHIRT